MNNPIMTMLVDIGILLVLATISLGIWFYPWFTVAAIAIAMCVGCFTSHNSS